MAAPSLAPVPLVSPAIPNTPPLTPPAISDTETTNSNGRAPAPQTKTRPASSSLDLRVIVGPLSLADRTRILSQYNRLTGSRVPVQQFRRWTEQSPSGPALHALVETKDGRIAGHCALVPFALQGSAGPLTVAKEHYFFLSEEYPSQPVQNFSESKRSAAALLLEQLHLHASEQGWQSVLACVPPQLEPIHDALGYRPVDFTVRDCFFILHPIRAWRTMHKLQLATQASLFAVSAANWAYASCISPFQRTRGLVRRSRIVDHFGSLSRHAPHRISLSDELEFLRWRYSESSYAPLVVNDGSDGYVIAAKGTPFAFARVCQFQVPSLRSVRSIIDRLLRDARASHAVGIRWSVYGSGDEQDRLVAELRKRTFLCIPRNRRILVSSRDPELTSAANWNLSDSLFTFDL
ncbi:MAG: GNAT family N-acetyltransferase [Candidatus Acidiferrales bacterium]